MPGSDLNVSPREKEQVPDRLSTALPEINPSPTEHEFRQKIANAYQQIGAIKPSLRNWIKIHLLLGFLMTVKLIPFILDKADVFILAIEELEVPKPLAWEWLWLSSCLACGIAMTAIKKNKIDSMRLFLYSEIFLGLVQIMWCFAYYFADSMTYLFTEDEYERDQIVYWKDLPYGLLNYIFVVGALQVHGFCIYYAIKLIALWTIKKERRSQ